MNVSSPAAGSTYSLFANLTNVIVIVFAVMEAYVSPVYMVLVCINALPCLSVFLFNREFQKTHSTNARYYYILLSLSDIFSILFWHLPYFVGDGLYYASGGRFYWYELWVVLLVTFSRTLYRGLVFSTYVEHYWTAQKISQKFWMNLTF